MSIIPPRPPKGRWGDLSDLVGQGKPFEAWLHVSNIEHNKARRASGDPVELLSATLHELFGDQPRPDFLDQQHVVLNALRDYIASCSEGNIPTQLTPEQVARITAETTTSLVSDQGWEYVRDCFLELTTKLLYYLPNPEGDRDRLIESAAEFLQSIDHWQRLHSCYDRRRYF